ncbi:substrate-binding domain-containing protein [Terracoccus luteus]|uniref:Monosaccharide ABC transporter substrate-binding protein (CUT2 family) n=1 Tax=Terracoccus luteus TaxID=53356 RepID=A0A495Y167_9MICO|nr:substrate-binding domain-containing protein [Terracoccus luteus]MBB2986599.1 ribose transport system substrate-binding protein [Terracoccus luteus]MCP2171812.1 ribose transport system substrate-binding protein [Terracoccus luteus]RKT79349.1 monosaccharide ABC transporter substrate-binding protein (CUT2 family) [Terracoccus luteus]
MTAAPARTRTRTLAVAVVALSASLVAAGCTSNTPEAAAPAGNGSTQAPAGNAGSSNDAPGEKVTIGFSGPAADHGWLGAINSAAQEEAKKFSDVDLKVAEGTNDASAQIAQIETFINDKVDAIVLLPTDGAALTDVATKAMNAGIPVINVDREFSSPFAARTTILGDNYGMGVSAGTYACEQVKEKNLSNPVIAEIAGIDALPLTQDRSKGFADALKACGQNVDNRVAAEFTVESGERQASNLIQAAPKIDIMWNHDDDQGIGVMAALDQANRHEMVFIGGAGSANAMRWIQEGKMAATVIYPPTQAADGINLARLIAQNKGVSDLVQVEVPKRVVLNAPVVTKENVEKYLPLGFES